MYALIVAVNRSTYMLVSNPPIAKVTLNGATAHTKAAASPPRVDPNLRPKSSRSRHVNPSATALIMRAICGNGALDPPRKLPMKTNRSV